MSSNVTGPVRAVAAPAITRVCRARMSPARQAASRTTTERQPYVKVGYVLSDGVLEVRLQGPDLSHLLGEVVVTGSDDLLWWVRRVAGGDGDWGEDEGFLVQRAREVGRRALILLARLPVEASARMSPWTWRQAVVPVLGGGRA